MGLLDLTAGKVNYKPKDTDPAKTDQDKAIYDSLKFPDPDALLVIQAAGEKARLLMQRLDLLFVRDPHTVTGDPVCLFCLQPRHLIHVETCEWQQAKDAYDDAVKYSAEFMK